MTLMTLKTYTICAVLAFLILAAVLVPSMRVEVWFICIGAGGIASMMVPLFRRSGLGLHG